MNHADWFDKKTKRTDILPDNIYDSWRIRILSKNEFAKLSEYEKLLYISHFGLLAPSSHNTVPQRIKIFPNESSIELWIDKQYILTESDIHGRQACISLGCALMNIELAAKDYQLKTTHKFLQITQNDILPYTGTDKQYVPVIKLSFKKTPSVKNNASINAILKRKVLRAEYDDQQKLPEELIQPMKHYAKKNFPSISLHILTNKSQIYTLAKLEEMASRTAFEKEQFSQELGQWILPNTNKTNPIGMRGREFGFDDKFSERVHEGLLKKIRLLPDEIATLAAGGKIAIKNSPAVGIITTPDDSIEDRVSAGSLYEYISLLLTTNNFFTSFHASFVEIDRVNKSLAAFLTTKERPTIIFRIGKPLNPKEANRPHSSRPKIEDIILTE